MYELLQINDRLFLATMQSEIYTGAYNINALHNDIKENMLKIFELSDYEADALAVQLVALQVSKGLSYVLITEVHS